MRRVRVEAYCDRCLELDGRDEPAVASFTVAAVEGERKLPAPRLLDMCAPHRDELAAILELVKARGAPPSSNGGSPSEPSDPASHPKRTDPCPACGRDYSSPHVLAKHVYTAHLHADMPPAPTVCPECGQEEASSRACAVHRSLRHGTSTGTDAIAALSKPRRRTARK